MTAMRQLIHEVMASDPIRRDRIRDLLRELQARNGGDEQDTCRYLYACGLMDAVTGQEHKP